MGGKHSQYDIGLDKNPANYVPLTPLSFLVRSAAVYPNHVSAVYEGKSFTWARPMRAAALRLLSGGPGHRRRRHGGGHAAEHSDDE